MSSSSNTRIVSELVKTDPELSTIVEEFVAALGTRLTRMEQALSKSDFGDLQTAAHQLKGSAGGYGYPTLTQTAGRLEQHAIDRTIDHCRASVAELKELIARVVVAE